MKTLFFLTAFLCAISIGAKDVSYMSPIPYTVVSDVFTNDLFSGEVRVKGVVFNESGVGVGGALISTIDERVFTLSDSTGAYELIIHDSDTSIFIYLKDHEEVAMDHYDFRAGHTVVVNVNLREVLRNLVPTDVIEMDDHYPVSFKPVIYLYATTSMQVSLSLDYFGDLTFTYPEYKDGWNVNLDKGGIHSIDGTKSFPYLFWEGDMGKELTYERQAGKLLGEIVKTDTLVEFLESQLTAMGLSRTEQTDFITFWVPRMFEKEYVFIQFLVDDLYAAKVASLDVSPSPDSQKRIYLLFTGYYEAPSIKATPQVFKPFKRKGFTLIEWGGSELLNLKSI